MHNEDKYLFLYLINVSGIKKCWFYSQIKVFPHYFPVTEETELSVWLQNSTLSYIGIYPATENSSTDKASYKPTYM